jgi:uncharacterized protein (DUF302 family)
MFTFNCDVPLPFDEAVEKFKQALAAEKMGVVSEINVQHVMKAKLNHDMPAYTILGACAPGLAKQVIESDPNAGALLPCGVAAMAVAANTTRFAFQDPEIMAGVSDNAVMQNVAKEAKAMLLRVRERLTQ